MESREQILSTAHAVKKAGATMLRGGAFKPRTSPYEFQGLKGDGLALLAESHLAIHTFPEHGFAALNVYCCRERVSPDFEALGARYLGAASCQVRELKRGVRA